MYDACVAHWLTGRRPHRITLQARRDPLQAVQVWTKATGLAIQGGLGRACLHRAGHCKLLAMRATPLHRSAVTQFTFLERVGATRNEVLVMKH